MNRDISPPPVKRRKTDAQTSIPTQTSSPNASAAPEPLPPLGANTLRIFSWNVNGIAPFLQKPITSFFQPSKSHSSRKDATSPASLRGFLHRHNWPSMLFLQEVKIANKDTRTQNTVRAAVNAHVPEEEDAKGPLYKAHFVLPEDPNNARSLRGSGKVYGVCSILRRDLKDRYNINVRTVDWDKQGRISVVELRSKSDSSKLVVFNIYAVNGTDIPYRDAESGAVKGTRHDRKREVHRLLMQECKQLEKEGWDILFGGDMNVAPDARDGHPTLRTFPQQHVVNRADFLSKLLGSNDEEISDTETNGLNGVDVWRRMHGDQRRYTYFSRGREWGASCDRVDYFIVGRRAWEKGCIKACGIMDSEADRGTSDHVPIWVDFNIKGKQEEQAEAEK